MISFMSPLKDNVSKVLDSNGYYGFLNSVLASTPVKEVFGNINPLKQSLGSVNSTLTTDTGLSKSIQSGAVTKDSTLGLSGTVVKGATVSVYDDAKFLGFATVNGTSWSFTSPSLADGSHNLKVVIKSPIKTESFNVGAVVDTVSNGTMSSNILTDTGTVKSILSGFATSDHTLGFNGTAEAGSAVKIYDGLKLLGQTTADSKGLWAYTTQTLTDGHHDFSAKITDLAGNVKDVTGVSADLFTPTPQPTAQWSAKSGWGSVDALAAINAGTGQSLADVKAVPGTQWGFDKANINDAWAYGYTGKGITIAAIDSGIDLKNADLTKNLSAYSWNFVDNNSDVMDYAGHGTFVASEMIAANNGIGLTGVSYDSTLMVLKTLDANGQGTSTNACAAIRYAVDHGANIINLSLGGADDPAYGSALQYARDHNVLVVMSAGNTGGSTPINPAAYAKQFDNCLAVGALECNKATGEMAMTTFSNQAGSTSSYGFVDAAGKDVVGYTLGNNVASWQGTSMAAPIAASTAALLWSADTTASAAHIAQTLSQTSHAVI